MSIQNFPAALQPIIQQGFLEREFQEALRSKLGYRTVADREPFAVGVGETVTKTRAGLKPVVTAPMAPANNTNLDNGLSSQGWGVEQYSVGINMYAATQDLNLVTSRVGIANQFLQNARTNAEQAARSLDALAQGALFASYFGGNTRVTTTLAAAGSTVSVDDVRGFRNVYVNGVRTPVSTTNTLTVTIGSDNYSVTGYAADATNKSTTPGGISGSLTVSGSITVADGTAGNSVIAATASTILRPGGRGNTSLLQGTDTLTMAVLLNAVATLRSNAVPDIDGAYNCFIDPVSSTELFGDPNFQRLYQGATGSNAVFKHGVVNDFLGLRFFPTTQAYVQPHPTLAGATVRRPIVAGAGALIEGDFAGMMDEDIRPRNALLHSVDDVVMVTREPLDRLQQIVAQSWYWIGGFCAPSDTTTTATTVPTASNANFKRAVIIEHV